MSLGHALDSLFADADAPEFPTTFGIPGTFYLARATRSRV